MKNDWGERCDCYSLEIDKPRRIYTRPAAVSKIRDIALTLKGGEPRESSCGLPPARSIVSQSQAVKREQNNVSIANQSWLVVIPANHPVLSGDMVAA